MVDPSAPAKSVAEKLGHTFGDLGLLLTALTHRSYVHEHPDSGSTDNERFEFLGDSIFGAAAAMELESRFPAAREGELTRRRADLVNERALAAIATSDASWAASAADEARATVPHPARRTVSRTVVTRASKVAPRRRFLLFGGCGEVKAHRMRGDHSLRAGIPSIRSGASATAARSAVQAATI